MESQETERKWKDVTEREENKNKREERLQNEIFWGTSAYNSNKGLRGKKRLRYLIRN